MIQRLAYVGMAATDLNKTRSILQALFDLRSWTLGAERPSGAETAACIPFANQCYLVIMHNSDPHSGIGRYLRDRGPGLARLGFITDDLQEQVERLAAAGVPTQSSVPAHGRNSERLMVWTGDLLGFDIELVQMVDRWPDCPVQPATQSVLGLQHIGVTVTSLDQAADRFKHLLGLEFTNVRTDQHGGQQKDATIEPGNDRLWLHVVESWEQNSRVKAFYEANGPGLDHICIEVADIRDAVIRVNNRGVPFMDHKIYTGRPDGFEAFVHAEHTTGLTIELIEPYPTSRGYRARKSVSRAFEFACLP